MNRDVIIALDFPNQATTLAFLERFGTHRPFVKIGMELFYAEGPQLVDAIKGRGHPVFLDLKLHDIPTTVQRAMASLSRLGVDMTNLHAAGTRSMMEAAREGLTRADGTRPLLIAVTQLTSTSETRMQNELGIAWSLPETVRRYAENAKAAGLDGVVCSPLEVPDIKTACGQTFLTVTPGVRLPGADVQDQVRVTTPADAKTLGSDYIVVGRPITEAADPLTAYEQCRQAFC